MVGISDGGAARGWWRAADGFWYPAEATPGRPWRGAVRGPDGEEPPGPGWWLASDYRWYPPDTEPGLRYPELVAVTPRDPIETEAGADGPGRAAGGGRCVPATAHLAAALDDERRRATSTITAGAAAVVAGAAAVAAADDAGWGPIVGRLGLVPLAVGGLCALVGGVRYLRSHLASPLP